ncbi:MAG: hypothetical protein U0931_19000 [Vulcanimicrobiota bacterium]
MRKLAFLALTALSALPLLARPLPRPVVIHGAPPTTATLREEILAENAQYRLQRHDFDLGIRPAWERSNFETVYDPMLRLKTYYDNHLLDELNRVDNSYGHNQPGIGINF